MLRFIPDLSSTGRANRLALAPDQRGLQVGQRSVIRSGAPERGDGSILAAEFVATGTLVDRQNVEAGAVQAWRQRGVLGVARACLVKGQDQRRLGIDRGPELAIHPDAIGSGDRHGLGHCSVRRQKQRSQQEYTSNHDLTELDAVRSVGLAALSLHGAIRADPHGRCHDHGGGKGLVSSGLLAAGSRSATSVGLALGMGAGVFVMTALCMCSASVSWSGLLIIREIRLAIRLNTIECPSTISMTMMKAVSGACVTAARKPAMAIAINAGPSDGPANCATPSPIPAPIDSEGAKMPPGTPHHAVSQGAMNFSRV